MSQAITDALARLRAYRKRLLADGKTLEARSVAHCITLVLREREH